LEHEKSEMEVNRYNYQIIDLDNLDPQKHSIALGIVQAHLIQNNNSLSNVIQNEKEIKGKITNNYNLQIHYLSELLPELNSLLQLKENECVIANKDFENIEQEIIKNESERTNTLRNSQILSAINLEKEKISQINKELNEVLDRLNYNNAQISYNRLLKAKDQNEITTWCCITSLLKNEKDPQPQLVEKTIRNSSKLIEEMKALRSCDIDIALQCNANIQTLLHLTIVNNQEKNQNSNQYEHLVDFIIWIKCISEYVLIKKNLDELDNKSQITMTKANEKQELINSLNEVKNLFVYAKKFKSELNDIFQIKIEIEKLRQKYINNLNLLQMDEDLNIRDVFNTENKKIEDLYNRFNAVIRPLKPVELNIIDVQNPGSKSSYWARLCCMFRT